MAKDTLLKPADDVFMWVEQESSIMLKAVSGTDPVELTGDEVEAIIAALQVSLRRLREYEEK